MKIARLTCVLLSLGLAHSAIAADATAPATRIAVIDREAALLGTDAAKRAQEKLEADLKPQRARMDALRKEIKALEEKFVRDAAALGDKEKKAIRDQADAKAAEFNKLVQDLQQRTAKAQKDLLDRLLPTLQTALDDLRKAGNYDLIVDRRAVVYADQDIDLTKRVVDRLNAGK